VPRQLKNSGAATVCNQNMYLIVLMLRL